METIVDLIVNQGLAIALIVLIVFCIGYIAKKAVPRVYSDLMARFKTQDERLDRIESKVDKLEVVIDNNTRTSEKLYELIERISER